MLERIRRRHHPEVTAAAARRYGLDPDGLEELDGYENLVYGAGDLVLRIAHSMRRSATQVAAELDWVNRLGDAGCPVARPVAAADGSLVVSISDPAGGEFVAAAFSRGPGVILDDDPEAKRRFWSAGLFARWGAVVARMHDNGGGPTVRPHWHQIDEIARLDDYLAAAPAAARDAAFRHVAKLRAEPPGDAYGLIHGDPTQWNFVVDEAGEPTFFDFDSAMRCWFAMDVAVALYYARISNDGDEAAFIADFLRHFVSGYRQVRPLPAAELARLPDLLRLQTVILYAITHRDLDETGTSTAEFRARAERRLIDGEPEIDLSEAFGRLAGGRPAPPAA